MTNDEVQRVIVMEGPDGVGKTNIGQGLSEKLDIPYFRMGSQHDNWRKKQFKTALQFDQTYLTEFLIQTGHSAVIDRAWPSEWVYSRVYKRDTDHHLLDVLDYHWSSMGAWIIIPLRRSFEGVREDEVVKKDELKAIQDTYLEFSVWTSCNVLSLYVDEPGVDCNLDEELRIIVPELRDNWDRRTKALVTYGLAR